MTKSELRKTKEYKMAVRKLRAEVLNMLLDPLTLAAKDGMTVRVAGVEYVMYPRLVAAPMDYHECVQMSFLLGKRCPQCSYVVGMDGINGACRIHTVRDERRSIELVDRALNARAARAAAGRRGAPNRGELSALKKAGLQELRRYTHTHVLYTT